MSTQAIGVAVAGTAVIGGGGTLAAYAAGAFDSKYESFEDYVDKALKDKSQYLGDLLNKDKVKAKLSESNNATYKKELEKVVVKGGDSSAIKKTDIDTASNDDDKSTKIAAEAKSWCDDKKTKKPSNKGTWTKATIEKDLDWAPFSAVCLEPVTPKA
ncbi:hypothetical protein [Candidatus Mycoplasma haematohominis]|uniref:hypothetical protein n=1 Tax=Candidatus Mycoplasma haematohominis TaxID=1494318 RepID=UPI001C0A7101|nr:hypothetical protein [Candidatus Mycoplasma haemohominis]